jgi:hypothetical protein
MCLSTLSGFAQSTITGIIKDTSGNPLPGVTVSIKGTTKTGTISNIEGRYNIKTSNYATLIFSYIGMKSQEVNINDIHTQI